MTIALIVPNAEKFDENKLRRFIEAIKKSKWIYLINLCFVSSNNEIMKFAQRSNEIFDDYVEEDFKMQYYWSDVFWNEDKIKNAIAYLDNDFYCVIDPDVVMFQTFFQRLIEWFVDEWHDVWMVCPRFTIGDKAFDGGVYFEPWKKCFMIEKRHVEEFLNKSFFDYTNDNVSKILRNCVCHYYGSDTGGLRTDNLTCDLYI